MAKKFSPFADDFEQLSKTAESAVKLVRQSESQNSISSRKKNDQKSGSVTESVSLKPRQKNKPRKPRSWGKPVATFNTRIPEQMSGLLDDLVYRLRKSGKSKSKQELAHEAIEDLLKKHKLL